MNSTQAKRIPLENILGKMGKTAHTQKGSDIWYHSPFRDEKTASFKVNKLLNTWYDFGLGQGGTVIDFICEYYGDNVKQALERLNNNHLSTTTYYPKNRPYTAKKPAQNRHISQPLDNKQSQLTEKASFHIDKVSNITDSTLIDYLKTRGINTDIATKYLKQIQFHYGEQTWKQLALGFINDCGGYEIRNAKFKGFVHPKADQLSDTGNQKTITGINIQAGNKLAIFEGFMDFLSYLTCQNITNYQHSAVILNSTSNYQSCQQLLKKYEFSKVYFFLDNDDTGTDTLKKLTLDEKGQPVSFEWVDKSNAYAGFNDMNDFLCNNTKSSSH